MARWILIITGSIIVICTYGLDFIKGAEEITLGPKVYTLITFGLLLVLIGIIFFNKKK